jgi:hypothetical protein
MDATKVLAAILRGAQERAPQDDGGGVANSIKTRIQYQTA